MAEAIVLRNLTKTFGEKTAVRDLDLVVPQGALYGIIGPNGAGKTTTIRIILSILFADRGDVQVLGRRSALDAKDRIGYLPEERGVYKKMKVGDFLLYMARLKGCEEPGLERRVRQWLERMDLGGVERKRCDELSKGMQQKVQFLTAILHEPDLLILDEPFSGLDPINMRLLRDLVREQHERGATILFSTHVMTQAEQLCQHIVMIHDGAKVLDDDMESIRNAHTVRSLWFEPLDPHADVARLGRLEGIGGVAREGAAYALALADGTDPAVAMRDVLAAMPAARIELCRPSLEDVFVEIVTQGAAASEEAARLRAALRDNGAAAREVHA
jgi:ABC-2 type transport system ATP-binding protein